MQFEEPLFLFGLLILLPLAFLFLRAVKLFKSFESLTTYSKFQVQSKIPGWHKRYSVYGLYTIAVVVIVCGLAAPYLYLPAKYKQHSNIRLLFVVDVSRSMVYAEDVSPNRLFAVKKQIKDFYLGLDGVYECSILPFAGDPNSYFCPFTTDGKAFLQMLDELNWDSAPSFGTDLTATFASIKDVYIGKDKIDQSGLNIIILFSDGGKEEALATDRPKLIRLANELVAKNFKIYSIGVGGQFPVPLVIRNAKGVFKDHVRDAKGHICYSQLDEEILSQLAVIGSGRYYNLNASTEISTDLNRVLDENKSITTDKIKLQKFQINPYLFLIGAGIIFICLFLNRV
jgi:hypothetical protein